jgi:hypothetical protein
MYSPITRLAVSISRTNAAGKSGAPPPFFLSTNAFCSPTANGLPRPNTGIGAGGGPPKRAARAVRSWCSRTTDRLATATKPEISAMTSARSVRCRSEEIRATSK